MAPRALALICLREDIPLSYAPILLHSKDQNIKHAKIMQEENVGMCALHRHQ